MEHWEHYDLSPRTIGVRGFGGTEADALKQAALALTAAVTPPQQVAPNERVVIRCEGRDEDERLACWLDELRREMEARGMLFSRFEVWLDGPRLTAHAWGEPLNPERHRPRLRLKGARRETLRVARHGEGWLAQGVLETLNPEEHR